MKIETIKTETLVPYARNAKKHDAGQVAKIAGSIREFGFCNPVLIDKTTESSRVMVGCWRAVSRDGGRAVHQARPPQRHAASGVYPG